MICLRPGPGLKFCSGDGPSPVLVPTFLSCAHHGAFDDGPAKKKQPTESSVLPLAPLAHSLVFQKPPDHRAEPSVGSPAPCPAAHGTFLLVLSPLADSRGPSCWVLWLESPRRGLMSHMIWVSTWWGAIACGIWECRSLFMGN